MVQKQQLSENNLSESKLDTFKTHYKTLYSGQIIPFYGRSGGLTCNVNSDNTLPPDNVPTEYEIEFSITKCKNTKGPSGLPILSIKTWFSEYLSLVNEKKKANEKDRNEELNNNVYCLWQSDSSSSSDENYSTSTYTSTIDYLKLQTHLWNIVKKLIIDCFNKGSLPKQYLWNYLFLIPTGNSS